MTDCPKCYSQMTKKVTIIKGKIRMLYKCQNCGNEVLHMGYIGLVEKK